jgi:serine/threonine-protein kinase
MERRMTPERWQQALDAFIAAIERPKAERSALLDEVCGDDADLREEVESLLRTYEEDPDFLEDAAAQPTELVAPPDPEHAVEFRVGPYKVLRRLGEGGMGNVFLAVRDDDQYRKHVALKIVKRGMDTENILRRFRSERQILASLDHPHIARLFDGGMTDDGRPFFVMEYIEGAVPIDEYCDKKKLSVTERLMMFRKVCSAVHTAHQSLVVHRDLKPSNILVSSKGDVKLLDFGIAKLLTPDLSPVTLAHTGTQVRLMTPQYASPEQVRGDVITTASDQYSLGVILYELLTGRRPYRITAVTTEEIARVICEEEPERPSKVVTRPGEIGTVYGSERTITPEAVSADRATTVDRLRRKLGGELDIIVLKAMQKDSQRRYASVEALSEDLLRFLEARPVTARKDTVGYLVRKFVQRHRVGVAAAMLILLSLLLGIGGTAWQARVAMVQRDRARVEARKAAQVSEFVTEVFKLADPTFSKGENITARELLDQGALRMETELADQPEVRAQVMQTMGEVYMNLSLYDRADSLLVRALGLRRQMLGDAHPDVASNLIALGTLAHMQSQLPKADSLLSEALAMRRRLFGPKHPVTAVALDELAQVRLASGHLESSETLAREALTTLEDHHGRQHADVARAMNTLANTLRQLDAFDEAEALMREALATRRALLGDRHTAVANSAGSLAKLLREQNRYEEAEPLLRETVDLTRRLYGKDHPLVAAAMNDLAGLLMATSEYEEADSLYREAIDIAQRSLGQNNLTTAGFVNNLVSLRLYEGDYEAAVTLLREIIPITEYLVGEQHPTIAGMRYNLSYAMSFLGDVKGAESELRKVLAIERGLYGNEHTEVAGTMSALSTLLWEMGEYEDAIAVALEALSIRRKLLPEDHTSIATSLYNLGVQFYYESPADAVPMLQEALAIYRKRYPEDHPMIASTQVRISEVLLKLGDPERALGYVQEGLGLLRSKLQADDFRVLQAEAALGACLSGLGRHSEAEPLLIGSYKRMRESTGVSNDSKESTRMWLVDLYEAWGKPDEAARYRTASPR